ncbi:MAG: hypothetical protein ABI646_04235 [Acidobacteriota bacterium]
MYTKTITAFYVCILILIAISAATAQAPTRKSEAVVTYDDIRAGTCDALVSSVGVVTPATPNDTILFNRTYRGQPNPQFCQPLLNPDGTQMTLGQYAEVSGRAAVKCIRRGSHSVMQFTGLRPNGLYSIWIVLFGSMPGPPIGVGAIGPNGPYENGFTADAEGVGQIGQITPEQDLSIFGRVGPCMLDSPLVLEVVYHGDGLLHGGDPGPGYTWVTNAAFIYR